MTATERRMHLQQRRMGGRKDRVAYVGVPQHVTGDVAVGGRATAFGAVPTSVNYDRSSEQVAIKDSVVVVAGKVYSLRRRWRQPKEQWM